MTEPKLPPHPLELLVKFSKGELPDLPPIPDPDKLMTQFIGLVSNISSGITKLESALNILDRALRSQGMEKIPGSWISELISKLEELGISKEAFLERLKQKLESK